MRKDGQESRARDETISNRHPLDDVEGIIDPFEITTERYNVKSNRNQSYGSMKGHVYGISKKAADAIVERSQRKHPQDNYKSQRTRFAEPEYPYGMPAPIIKDGSVALVVIPHDITSMRGLQLLKKIDEQTERRLYAFLVLCRTAGYLPATEIIPPAAFYAQTHNVTTYDICTTIAKCFKEAKIPESRRFIRIVDLNPKIKRIRIAYDNPSIVSSRERLEAISLLEEFARGPSR